MNMSAICSVHTNAGGPIYAQDKHSIPSIASDLGHNEGEGPITPSFLVDVDRVVALLNQAVASELTAFLSYTAHAAAAGGLREEVAQREFAEHAEQELGHARALIARIDELGGIADLDPSTFARRSIAPFCGATGLDEMLAHQMQAERGAVELYRNAIQWLGDRDPTTRRLLEDILSTEERHARDIQTLLDSLTSGGA
ncbi:MAG: ferritin-like domain-containing protein [Myxococcota bacterium]